MNEGPQIQEGQPMDADPQTTPYIDTHAIKTALQETAPAPAPRNAWVTALVCAAIIGVCLTTMSLVANLSLYRWGADKSDQVKALSASSECRSMVAADTDVKQGDFLKDLGRVNLATARALAALGTNDDSGVVALVEQLKASSDDLDRTLRAYGLQIQERAKTADTCNEK